MTLAQARPDTKKVLESLKDFQRKTVDYVFRRLYLDEDRTNRFLVADEVGLGKTLVARGLIARTIDHLWDTIERIDIVYICSNADIARQNVNRLNITEQREREFDYRLTLLPTKLHNLRNNKLNFISFTPGTTFDLKSSTGKADERALLYWLLKDDWNLQGVAAQNVLQGTMGKENFRELIKNFPYQNSIDEGLRQKFVTDLRNDPEYETLRVRFDQLCEWFKRTRDMIPANQRQERNRFIGDMRRRLAQSCLEALEPDLIILDEFQRFKHLLNVSEDDEVNYLAHKLFNYADEHTEVKVVLLSATPYKMYTLSHETEDDHYEDFLRTIQFLQHNENHSTDNDHNNGQGNGTFDRLIASYRRALINLKDGDRSQLFEIKEKLQQYLKQVMVRTERLAASQDRNGMLVEIPSRSATLETSDLTSYIALRQVAQILRHHDVMEYWKSSPYLLNFMDEYRLKQSLRRDNLEPAQEVALAKILAASKDMLLPWQDVTAYAKIDPGNARLRSLFADVIESGAWQLLWIPPSLNYYQPAGVYAQPELANFTKRLVFSSWQVVPKVIAMLLSYEAERQMMKLFDMSATHETRGRFHQMLRFARSSGRLTGMPVLALIYPCMTLARECDPLKVATELSSTYKDSQQAQERLQGIVQEILNQMKPLLTISQQRQKYKPDVVAKVDQQLKLLGEKLKQAKKAQAVHEQRLNNVALPPSLEAVRAYVERKITTLLEPIVQNTPDDGPEDESWYWAAPLVLDVHYSPEKAKEWFDTPNLPAAWIGFEDVSYAADEDAPVWSDHVDYARQLIQGNITLGRPPRDLAHVLAYMAIAAPGVTALRALVRVTDQTMIENPDIRIFAGMIAWSLRSLFNKPETIALIRGLNKAEPYWRRVLEYCADGGLQAVLDEYVHVLRESLGLYDQSATDTAVTITLSICEVLDMRTATLGVDEIGVDDDSETLTMESRRMRIHFALRFGEERDESGESTRKDTVRKAFNSPFHPFVLATTSVGQEGLDFHTYCHAIVHWNLPTNPVDLEQREGRIHRYKGHAVRKNVALAYGLREVKHESGDPWDTLFDAAKRDRHPDATDMVPFWIYQPPNGGGAKIERHVPVLPLSRDQHRLDSLRQSLTLYRMVFGQARQDDLMNYLQQHLSEEEQNDVANQLQMSLEPDG